MMTTLRVDMLEVLVAGLEMLLDSLLQDVFLREAYNRLDNSTALEDEQRGNTENLELHPGVRVVVDVQLADRDLAGVLGSEGVDRGRQAPAGAAPLGPEVHEYGSARLENRLVKVAVGKGLDILACHRFSLSPKP